MNSNNNPKYRNIQETPETREWFRPFPSCAFRSPPPPCYGCQRRWHFETLFFNVWTDKNGWNTKQRRDTPGHALCSQVKYRNVWTVMFYDAFLEVEHGFFSLPATYQLSRQLGASHSTAVLVGFYRLAVHPHGSRHINGAVLDACWQCRCRFRDERGCKNAGGLGGSAPPLVPSSLSVTFIPLSVSDELAALVCV